jgi:hypothetical protein
MKRRRCCGKEKRFCIEYKSRKRDVVAAMARSRVDCSCVDSSLWFYPPQRAYRRSRPRPGGVYEANAGGRGAPLGDPKPAVNQLKSRKEGRRTRGISIALKWDNSDDT